MLTNLACPISRLRWEWDSLRYRNYTIGRLGVMAQKAEYDGSEDNHWIIVEILPKSLNSRNIDKRVSDILIRIRFPFENSFWISGSGCKLTMLQDIQPANRIVIISGRLGSPGLPDLLFWRQISQIWHFLDTVHVKTLFVFFSLFGFFGGIWYMLSDWCLRFLNILLKCVVRIF